VLLFEPFCPVDTVLLFTVLLYCICVDECDKIRFTENQWRIQELPLGDDPRGSPHFVCFVRHSLSFPDAKRPPQIQLGGRMERSKLPPVGPGGARGRQTLLCILSQKIASG